MESETSLLGSESTTDSRSDVFFNSEDKNYNKMNPIQEELEGEIEANVKSDLIKSKYGSSKNSLRDLLKERISFGLSVFNVMNVILGSGILGLAEVVRNVGVVVFTILLITTAVLSCYQIYILLIGTRLAGTKSYEGLANKTFGLSGKIVVSIMIVSHCLGTMVSYLIIIKNELPELIKALFNYQQAPGEEIPFYLEGDFQALAVLVLIILPLAALKDISLLGYTSAFGMFCMFFFTITVVVNKFLIPCPLEEHAWENKTDKWSASLEVDGEQICKPVYATVNIKTAYALPTLVFAFMCHVSVLPIYAELKRPSVKKMQKVAVIAVFNIFVLYFLTAVLGYLTFYNHVQSELMLSYSLYNSKDTMIVIARMMVVICVTFSIPLLHYPARLTIISFFKQPFQFSWIRHIGVMIVNFIFAALLVLLVPNIRNIFGLSGATSSTCLLIVFPSAFLIKLTEKKRREYRIRRIVAVGLASFGLTLMITSTILIIIAWTNS